MAGLEKAENPGTDKLPGALIGEFGLGRFRPGHAEASTDSHL